MITEALKEEQKLDIYIPSDEDIKVRDLVLKDYLQGKNVLNKSYKQFNGRTLAQAIDDWTKVWNGYLPEGSPILSNYQSNIVINMIRNQVISYLAKVALNIPGPKISAVNRNTGNEDRKFADLCKDLNQYSLNEEDGPARFLESGWEAAVKGTVIKYEGYAKTEQETDIPTDFDAQTGKIKYKKGKRVIFDNCFQRIASVEDFYIANPYQPDVQKQPFIAWREVVPYSEAALEYGDYPAFKYVRTGFMLSSDPTTFYREDIQTSSEPNKVEVLRYYNRPKNKHVVLANGVVLYNGPFPFKDGMYPFAKGIHEPFDTSFFWGSSFINKSQGMYELINTTVNMMVDKNNVGLLPFGLTSDLDDIIEDNTLSNAKIWKVSDVKNWRFEQMPGVGSGELNMLQTILKLATDSAGNIEGGGQATTNRGGKLPVRQVLLQQQETMSKLGFTMMYLEGFERDRTELRIKHILQFYSIPTIEKITGKNGKMVEKLNYKQVKVPNSTLEDGKKGTKVISLINRPNPEERQQVADELSVTEAMGDITNTPTEAIAVSVESFQDFDLSVQVIRNSSYEKNSILDQAAKQEFANWRLGVAQLAPVDAPALVRWVEEAYDVDQDQFTPKGQPQNPMMQQQIGQQAPQGMQPAQQLAPKQLGQLSNAI